MCIQRPSSRASSAAAKKRKKAEKSGALYKISVVTGNKRNAGTDAKVFLTIKGAKGKIPRKQLKKKSGSAGNHKNARFRFTRDSTHIFKWDEKDVGNIQSIIIEVTFLNFSL
jgi:hypothetical protein